MNYMKIYEQLVKKRRKEFFEGYGENHHIIPKCLNGTDEVENIVRLTAREHFIAHALLCKIYPHEKKLWFAFNCMCNKWGQSDVRNERYYKISSKIYEWCKKEYSKILSQKMKGNIPWNKGRKGVQTLSVAARQKLSQQNSGQGNPMFGKPQSQKCKEINSRIHKGKKYSTEIRFKNKKRGVEHPRYGKHWGPEFGYKQTLAKCYTQIKRYNSINIDKSLWDKHKIMKHAQNISMDTILKRFGSFENMIVLLNSTYNTNFMVV